MRYVCPICGYIYDEAAEGVPFDSLPDSWGCPLCGAPKLMFEPEAAPEPPPRPPPPPKPPAAAPPPGARRRRPAAAFGGRAGRPLLQPGPRLRKAIQRGRGRSLPPDRGLLHRGRPRGGGPQPRSPGGAVPRRPGQRLSRPERRRHRPGGPGHPAHLRLGRKGDPNALRPAGPLPAGGRSLPPGHPGVGVLGLRLCVHRGHAPRDLPRLQSARMEI